MTGRVMNMLTEGSVSWVPGERPWWSIHVMPAALAGVKLLVASGGADGAGGCADGEVHAVAPARTPVISSVVVVRNFGIVRS